MLSDELVQTFQRLMADAEAAGETDANAMSLATTQADGRVSSRIVLMSEHEPDARLLQAGAR